MARGKQFALLPVDETGIVAQVGVVQQAVKDTFDQLEDARRGMLVSTVQVAPATQVLSEQLVVVYTGKGSDVIRLPPANLRGNGRGQILVVANQGTGSVTVTPVGNDRLNGPTALAVNGTAVFWSDGKSQWHEVTASPEWLSTVLQVVAGELTKVFVSPTITLGLPAVGPGAGLLGGGGIASITLDAKGRVTAVAVATYVVTTRSLTGTADITLDGVASATVDLSANRTIGLVNAGPGAGGIGSHSAIPVTITLDVKGRVTGVTTQTADISLGAHDLIDRRLVANQGTTLVSGDITLSAGWGTTRSVAVTASSKDTRGGLTVTCAGTGQAANPTITLTFKDGAFAAAPFALVQRNGGNQVAILGTWTTTTTTLVITFVGTPVAGETFGYFWQVLG